MVGKWTRGLEQQGTPGNNGGLSLRSNGNLGLDTTHQALEVILTLELCVTIKMVRSRFVVPWGAQRTYRVIRGQRRQVFRRGWQPGFGARFWYVRRRRRQRIEDPLHRRIHMLPPEVQNQIGRFL